MMMSSDYSNHVHHSYNRIVTPLNANNAENLLNFGITENETGRSKPFLLI